MVAIKSLVASTLFALLLIPAAALAAKADSPVLKLDAGDQAWARQALLRLTDFGFGWHGGAVKSTKPAGPSCPGFDPKETDLVVTGHANANFANPRVGVQIALDSQVLDSTDGVTADFARTIRPPLAACLAYQLRQEANVSAATVEPLAFPKVGSTSAAYRATLTIKSGQKTAKYVSDFLFFANGRLEYSLNVTAPQRFGAQVIPFEADMARMLVKRGAQRE